MQTFAERFLYLRKMAGMKQSEFARLINLSQGRLSDIEQGKNKPSADTLIAVVNEFSPSAEWLLLGKGSPPQTLPQAPRGKPDSLKAFDKPTGEEMQFLADCRLLNPANKRTIRKFMQFLLAEQHTPTPMNEH
ncbi:helix-turn-helix domain-containing protein [Paenibacillus sp. GCM10012307]|uniref:Helix-turn-helix transcriptional regulator n=1 Tax=Paenibacillus roseus TaxID=2798579 RepID=A0A934J0P6_9BACL|nr:helix-turn-helix transcriptional regulator [Paenibacillus roseus]MBJ6362687.1 helix-turn-helix transcriptional regulator [Paenibacillus roseus]